MRILQGKAAENAVATLANRGSRLEELEPRVRPIIRAVQTRWRQGAGPLCHIVGWPAKRTSHQGSG